MTPKNAKPTTLRGVGYVRVSRDRAGETSTTTQAAAIEQWCAAQGIELVDIVVEPGRSAYKASRTNRPGFKRVEQIIASGAANLLVAWKLNRVARNTLDTLQLVRDLDAKGASFASVSEPINMATPMGVAITAILAVLAELESATKAENLTEWHSHRRGQAMTPTGPRPYGYRRQRNTLILDPVEAAEIRKAADAVLAGASLRSLAADLDARHVPTSSGAKRWTTRGLRHILCNTTTAGLRELDDGVYSTGKWEPVLDRPTWDAVRKVLLDPARSNRVPVAGRRWLLPGIATCGRCEPREPLRSKPHSNGKPRYACGRCHLSVAAVPLDELVEDEVLRQLDAKAWQALRRRGRGPAVDIAAVEAELASLAARYADGDLLKVEWEALRTGIRARLDQAQSTPLALPDVANLRTAWAEFTVDEKRLVLSAVVDRVEIAPAGAGPRLPGIDSARVRIIPGD